jgi:hypothetical protein
MLIKRYGVGKNTKCVSELMFNYEIHIDHEIVY